MTLVVLGRSYISDTGATGWGVHQEYSSIRFQLDSSLHYALASWLFVVNKGIESLSNIFPYFLVSTRKFWRFPCYFGLLEGRVRFLWPCLGSSET